MSDDQNLKDTVKKDVSAASGLANNVSSAADKAISQTKTALESSAASVQGSIDQGVVSLQNKVDEIKGKISDIQEKGVGGLVTDGIESVKGMATDAITGAITSALTSKFGAKVNISYTDPDSYGNVFIDDVSLVPDGNDTLSSIIAIITGLAGGASLDDAIGGLQSAVIDATVGGITEYAKSLDGKVASAASVGALVDTASNSIDGAISDVVSSTGSSITNTAREFTFPGGVGAVTVPDRDVNGQGKTDDELYQSLLTDLEKPKADIATIFDGKEMRYDSDAMKGIAENITGIDGADALTAVEEKDESQLLIHKASEEYATYTQKRISDSKRGIVQGLATDLRSDAEKRIRDIAPLISKVDLDEVLYLCQGTSAELSEAIDIVKKYAKKTSYDDIKTLLETIDTTISTITKQTNPQTVFSAPYMVNRNAKNWKYSDPDLSFTYINSTEELEAEFRTVNREITEIVVHWTETHTNRNIGSEEIHKFHLGQGLNGIGYHYVIRRDGSLQRGRPLDLKGQHSPVNNHDNFSVGVIFVGGINVPTETPNPENFVSALSLTRSQFNTFDHICRAFYLSNPGGQIVGHNDIDEEEFDPGFDVIEYCEARFNKVSVFENPLNEKPYSKKELLSK
jgi:N-acetylmuramoyl-L-alanine amidase